MDKQDDVDPRAEPDDRPDGCEGSLSISREKFILRFSDFKRVSQKN